jgi:hypothetical protein
MHGRMLTVFLIPRISFCRSSSWLSLFVTAVAVSSDGFAKLAIESAGSILFISPRHNPQRDHCNHRNQFYRMSHMIGVMILGLWAFGTSKLLSSCDQYMFSGDWGRTK